MTPFALLALPIADVAERAARACAPWVGRGQEKSADAAAVEAMRAGLNALPMAGRVVIGEGERDEAPMLYIGEEVGAGGPAVDIALDPLEGTTLTAQARAGALTVLALAPAGALLHAPDIYMEKLAVGPGAAGADLDLDAPVSDTLRCVAKALGKPVADVVVCALDRERHAGIIADVRAAGARLQLIQDGDIAAVIAAARGEVDVYMGTGGAPEGVLAAAALRCTGGAMRGRLVFRNDAERNRAAQAGVTDPARVYTESDMAAGQDILFAATGVTDGPLVHGVRAGGATQTLLLQLCPEAGRTQRLIATTPLD
jgi:fructose-1,6-bisphosphatase II / sedoheptulose-1,7-bisphosphatase